MDDDSGETGIRDIPEDLGEGVEREQDNDGGNDTSKGGAHTGLGLDGSTGEGSGGRVGAEEGPEQVGDTDGDELLRGIDDIVVDATKGLGDGDVLDEHDDDGGRQLRDKGLDNLLVDSGDGGVSETCESISTELKHHDI